MEDIFAKLIRKEPNFEIIGKDQQILQVLLIPQQSIFTRGNSILYLSTNLSSDIKLPNSNIMTILSKIRKKGLNSDELNFEICNKSERLGYVGIAKKAGKILALNPIIFNNFCIKEKNVLAYSKQVNILRDYKPLFKPFCNVKWIKIMNINLENIEKESDIFIQSDSTLIEKELGQNESILVREDSVLAYSFSVIILPNTLSCFSNTNVKNKQLIEIIGPGMIILENQPETNNNMLRNFRIFEILILIMLLNAIWTFTELLSFGFMRNLDD